MQQTSADNIFRYIFFIAGKGLDHCMRGNFSCFNCRHIFFSKSTFSKDSFRNTSRVSNILDPDQAQQNVKPDLGPNCLQRLSADDKIHHKKAELTCMMRYTVWPHVGVFV